MKIRLIINKKGKLVEDMILTIQSSSGTGRVWMSEIMDAPCTIPLSSLVKHE